METVAALAAAAPGLSLLIGRSLTASFLVVGLGGLLASIGFAVLFFLSRVTVGHFMPHPFDPWLLGLHFIALMVGAPPTGAAIALLTHRPVERVDAARLPF